MLPEIAKLLQKLLHKPFEKCCLKNYLNTAFFEKKYCNRVFAIFYCAITMVWSRLLLNGPLSYNFIKERWVFIKIDKKTDNWH